MIEQEENYHFYYHKEKEYIDFYQDTLFHYAYNDFEDNRTLIGQVNKKNVTAKEWEVVIEIFVKRNKKFALLYRTSPNQIMSWACNKILFNEDFITIIYPFQ